jgi:hypothetical protein
VLTFPWLDGNRDEAEIEARELLGSEGRPTSPCSHVANGDQHGRGYGPDHRTAPRHARTGQE